MSMVADVYLDTVKICASPWLYALWAVLVNLDQLSESMKLSEYTGFFCRILNLVAFFFLFFFPPWETIQHTRVYLWLKRKWTWSKTYLFGFLVFALFLIYVTECIFVSFKLDISSWLNSVRICWFRVFQMGLYSYNFRLFQTISILNRNSIIIFIKNISFNLYASDKRMKMYISLPKLEI